MTEQTKQCPTCGTSMNLREKEGSKFWGCPNWQTKGCKTQKYYPLDGGFQKFIGKEPKEADGFKILADEVMAMRGELKDFLKIMREETGM